MAIALTVELHTLVAASPVTKQNRGVEAAQGEVLPQTCTIHASSRAASSHMRCSVVSSCIALSIALLACTGGKGQRRRLVARAGP